MYWKEACTKECRIAKEKGWRIWTGAFYSDVILALFYWHGVEAADVMHVGSYYLVGWHFCVFYAEYFHTVDSVAAQAMPLLMRRWAKFPPALISPPLVNIKWLPPARNPSVIPQSVVFKFKFLHKLNKRDTTCQLLSVRGVGRWILLPFRRSQTNCFLSVFTLCAHWSYMVHSTDIKV